MGDKHNEKKITPRSVDYARWYQDIISVADLAEHAPAKGSMIIKPYGYAIWENIVQVLDKKFKETGVKNAYFPLLIPEKLLNKEKEHVEGFSPEVAVVTHVGGKKLKEPFIIRPTSETIIYEAFSKWIQSYRDLPLLINQWANVVRWELRPRLFLRTTEFLWQEGHTVHATSKESKERVLLMLKVYEEFVRNYMAMPVVTGIKTENEKFAGADETYTVEAMMQDGKALQLATSHNLGQNFAKAFDLKFAKKDGGLEFCWQTSWGISTRAIGALIMEHSDDKGLVLPPKIAPISVVIIPIYSGNDKKRITEKVAELKSTLADSYKITVLADFKDATIGEKHYEWEKKGVPLRVELGPKDIEKGQVVVIRRDTGERVVVPMDRIGEFVKKTLEEIQANLYKRASKFMEEKTKYVDTWEDFAKQIEGGNFVYAHWCGDTDAELEIKEKTGATIRCIPLGQKEERGKGILTGGVSNRRVLFAKSY